MGLDIRVTVNTGDGVDLEYPAVYVDDQTIYARSPKYYAQDLESALTDANRVLGSKLKKLYGDIRED